MAGVDSRVRRLWRLTRHFYRRAFHRWEWRVWRSYVIRWAAVVASVRRVGIAAAGEDGEDLAVRLGSFACIVCGMAMLAWANPNFPWAPIRAFIGLALIVVALLVLGPFVLLAPLVAGVFLVARARTLSDALFSIFVLLFGLYACRVVVAARLGPRWSKIPTGSAVAISIVGGAYAALLMLLDRVPETELAAMVRRFTAYHEAVEHWGTPIRALTVSALVALTGLSYRRGAGDLAAQWWGRVGRAKTIFSYVTTFLLAASLIALGPPASFEHSGQILLARGEARRRQADYFQREARRKQQIDHNRMVLQNEDRRYRGVVAATFRGRSRRNVDEAALKDILRAVEQDVVEKAAGPSTHLMRTTAQPVTNVDDAFEVRLRSALLRMPRPDIAALRRSAGASARPMTLQKKLVAELLSMSARDEMVSFAFAEFGNKVLNDAASDITSDVRSEFVDTCFDAAFADRVEKVHTSKTRSISFLDEAVSRGPGRRIVQHARQVADGTSDLDAVHIVDAWARFNARWASIEHARAIAPLDFRPQDFPIFRGELPPRPFSILDVIKDTAGRVR